MRSFLSRGPFEDDGQAGRRAPQYQLAIVLGDYWWRRSEPLPSAALVDLLAEFGVSEASARQAMRRLGQRGTLVVDKRGRTTSYGFPPRRETDISTRIETLLNFGRDYPEWDGAWTIALFSVPESIRDVRRSLRSRLHHLHFGMLHDATWISPHDRVEEAKALFASYHVDDAHVFRGHHAARDSNETDLRAAFDLNALAEDYREFAAYYDSVPHDDASALVGRTFLMYDWQYLRRSDPNLPRELLPDDWPRDEAYRVFSSRYRELGPAAERQFRQIVARHAPHLAELAAHHGAEPRDPSTSSR